MGILTGDPVSASGAAPQVLCSSELIYGIRESEAAYSSLEAWRLGSVPHGSGKRVASQYPVYMFRYRHGRLKSSSWVFIHLYAKQ